MAKWRARIFFTRSRVYKGKRFNVNAVVDHNLAHEEMLVEYDPQQVAPADLRHTLPDLGYTVHDPGKGRTCAGCGDASATLRPAWSCYSVAKADDWLRPACDDSSYLGGI